MTDLILNCRMYEDAGNAVVGGSKFYEGVGVSGVMGVRFQKIVLDDGQGPWSLQSAFAQGAFNHSEPYVNVQS